MLGYISNDVLSVRIYKNAMALLLICFTYFDPGTDAKTFPKEPSVVLVFAGVISLGNLGCSVNDVRLLD